MVTAQRIGGACTKNVCCRKWEPDFFRSLNLFHSFSTIAMKKLQVKNRQQILCKVKSKHGFGFHDHPAVCSVAVKYANSINGLMVMKSYCSHGSSHFINQITQISMLFSRFTITSLTEMQRDTLYFVINQISIQYSNGSYGWIIALLNWIFKYWIKK